MQRPGKSVQYEGTAKVKAAEEEPTLHNCKKSEQRAEGREKRSDPDRTDPAELGFLQHGAWSGFASLHYGALKSRL